MTGKTLRELLPAGSPRNKIEFLADELQHGLELLGQLGKARMTNYVKNPAFLDSASNKAQETKFTGVYLPGSRVGSPNQNAGTFADGWHFEQSGTPLDQAIIAAFGVHRNLHFAPFLASVPFKAHDIWVAAKNCKGTIYQQLNLPKTDSYYKAHAIFAAVDGMTVTLGFRSADTSTMGGMRSDTSQVTTGGMYGPAPSTGYNVKVLESDVFRHHGSDQRDTFVCLEIMSNPGEMNSLMLLGMQVIEVDKDGKPVENGIINMDSDGYGHLRFNELIEFVCNDTEVAGNRFTFKPKKPGSPLHCPLGIHQHVTYTNLYFWGGVNGVTSGDVDSTGKLDEGVTVTDFNGDAVTIELSQANADLVRNCGGMQVYLRYTQTPMRRGLYT